MSIPSVVLFQRWTHMRPLRPPAGAPASGSLATADMGRTLETAVPVLVEGRELGPHLTQSVLSCLSVTSE